MTYTCPHCGKELDETTAFNGICPGCHKGFDVANLNPKLTSPTNEQPKQPQITSDLLNPNITIDHNDILRGKIIESKKKKANPILKMFSAFGILFMGIYYLIALALCVSIIGLILGIYMFVGAAAIQVILFSVLQDGTKYKIECPICQREINCFKQEKAEELSVRCPSCKKNLIVRENEVLHFK